MPWLRVGRWIGIALVAASLLCLCDRPSQAMMKYKDPPVERLVANLTAYIKEHPKDPAGYYRLGRVHTMAFVHRCQSLTEWTIGTHYDYSPELVAPAPTAPATPPVPAAPPKPMTDAEAADHCKAALENLAKAIELAPQVGLYRLGLAYLLEHGADHAAMAPFGVEAKTVTEAETARWEVQVQLLADPDKDNQARGLAALQQQSATVLNLLLSHLKDPNETIRKRCQDLVAVLWREQAIVQYLKVYEMGGQVKGPPEQSFNDFGTVYLEAGDAYVRLVNARGATKAEKPLVEKIGKDVTEHKPQRRDYSPIVFSLAGARPLSALVDRDKTVDFDLTGTDTVQRWTWVKPDTGILVWDPKCEGKITSGRQLFGNVTWWIFWNNGYEALDALDDNRDGVLTGAELTGLAVWRDANQNGVSDPGEVVPVVNLGIDAISVRTTETEDGCPANKTGLHLTNGKTLPTYDWYASGTLSK